MKVALMPRPWPAMSLAAEEDALAGQQWLIRAGRAWLRAGDMDVCLLCWERWWGVVLSCLALTCRALYLAA